MLTPMLTMLALRDRLLACGETDLRDGDVVQWKHVTAQLLADPPMADFIGRQCQSDVERLVLDTSGVEADFDRIKVEVFTPAELGRTWHQHQRWFDADPELLNVGAVVAYWRKP